MTRRPVSAAVVILLVLSAQPALAQKDVFIDAFIRLHSALWGRTVTRGRESPRNLRAWKLRLPPGTEPPLPPHWN